MGGRAIGAKIQSTSPEPWERAARFHAERARMDTGGNGATNRVSDVRSARKSLENARMLQSRERVDMEVEAR